MENVVVLSSVEERKALKARLWNPPNARQSSEMEITTEPELRRRRIEQIKQADEALKKRQWSEIIDRMKEQAEARAADLERKAQEEQAAGILSSNIILKVVASWFAITVVDLISERRTKDVTHPRHIAMYLCRHHTRLSYPKIGRKFGNRDHTTVLYSINKIARLIEQGDVETAVDIVRLRRILGVEGK